jgi:hypothetical protein
MKNIPEEIKEKMIECSTKADPAYGGGIAKELGL